MSIDDRNAWVCEECRSKIPKSDNTNIPVRPVQQSAGRTGIPIRPGHQQAAAPGRGKTQVQIAASSSTPRNSSLISDITTTSGNYGAHSDDQEIDDVDGNAPITRKVLQNIIAQEIGNTLKCVALEQRQLREVVDSFQQAISFFSSRYDELKATVDEKTEKIDRLEKDNISLRESLQNLTKRVNISEQHSRASNIEIQCVPENNSEKLVTSILKLSEEIKCDIVDADIAHCTRVAKKNPDNTRPRSILVKFNNPRLRDSFLAAATKYNRTHPKNRLSSRHLGSSTVKPQPIYVVEHLSAELKSIHAATRARARELGYKFVWVRNGRIFIKKSEESNRIFIDSAEQLDSLH